MTPERLAEIHENDRRDRFRGTITASVAADIADHRAELLAYVDELRRELDEITDLDRTALKTQELRDERHRAVAMWHDEKKRAEKAEAERDELRARLEHPCDGTDCEDGGAVHCHACPEAEANRLLAERDELRAENEHFRSQLNDDSAKMTRDADEIDSLHQSLDRARTDWHDLTAERDQARQIARDLATALTTAVRELDGEHDLHTLAVAWGHWPTADGPSDWLLNDALPDWLTENGGAK